MQLQHHFTVPVPIEVAWPALLDPEGVAPCMPGATLNRAEGNEFGGSVKVKLGPISLLYKGTGTFTEIDADSHRVVIDASGKDSRGNGTAAATVTAVLSPEGGTEGGSTAVTVDTDLKVTGKPAQLGRGLISEVGGKIIDQFAGCLAERLAGREQAAQEAGEPVGASSAGRPPAAEPTPVEQALTYGQENGDGGADEPATAGETAATGRDGQATGQPAASAPSASSTTVEEPAHKADAVVAGRSMPSEEAINLLDTAGAPVLRRLAPVVGGLVAVVVVALLRRRRRRRRR